MWRAHSAAIDRPDSGHAQRSARRYAVDCHGSRRPRSTGGHKDVLEQVRKAGLVKVRVDNELYDIEQVPELAVRKKHTIDAIVDKIIVRPGSTTRLADSVRLALSLANGLVTISSVSAEQAKASVDSGQQADWHERLFSTLYACANCGVSYEELEPRTFSFNSPYGACPTCQGMGTQPQFDPESIVVDWERSPSDGAILPWQTSPAKTKRALRGVFEKLLSDVGGEWDKPLSSLKAPARKQLINGSSKGEGGGRGIIGHLQQLFDTATAKEDSSTLEWLDNYRQALPCPDCGGSRLRREAMSVTVDDLNIYQLCCKSVTEVRAWLDGFVPDVGQAPIVAPIVKPIRHRLEFLDKVGLGYLTLERGVIRSAAESFSACAWPPVSAVVWLAFVMCWMNHRSACISATMIV